MTDHRHTLARIVGALEMHGYCSGHGIGACPTPIADEVEAMAEELAGLRADFDGLMAERDRLRAERDEADARLAAHERAEGLGGDDVKRLRAYAETRAAINAVAAEMAALRALLLAVDLAEQRGDELPASIIEALVDYDATVEADDGQ